jgi:hypothetical protein
MKHAGDINRQGETGMRKNALIEMLQEALGALNDSTQPYVYRRDAAEMLGRAAAHAASALKRHENETDPDVRMAVERGLGEAQAALRGVTPRPLEKEAHSLEQLARACEKKDKRVVTPHGDGFAIDVVVNDSRRQRVVLLNAAAQDGSRLVRVFTTCGPPTEKMFKWALRTNLQFVHGALALTEEEGREQLVMTCNFPADEVGPDEVKAAVKEVAFYGDWIERKLTREDVH